MIMEPYPGFFDANDEFNSSDPSELGSINGVLPSQLKFSDETKKYKRKRKEMVSELSKSNVDTEKLKKFATSEGGLVDDSIRREAWPKILGIFNLERQPVPTDEELKLHPEYQQVVLDVNRSLKRFPPGIPLDQRLALQSQLTRLILRVILAHPRLRYYQGYHDVAVTLLLVTGEDAAFLLLEKLSTNHLKDCMEPTMDKTSQLLNYIYPLVRHQNQKVYEHMEKSGVGTMFALPWFLTWFGHSLNQYKHVVRLYDFFLANECLTPLYLSSVIVMHRAKEILDTPCDIASMHSLLSQIPDDLPFEKLLVKTSELYRKWPPDLIHKEVLERIKLEQERFKMEQAMRQRRIYQNTSIMKRLLGRLHPGRQPFPGFVHPYIPVQFARYKYLVATVTFAVGLTAYFLKSVEAAELNDTDS